MRGDFQQSTHGLAQAVAVLDLSLGGVHAEMGEVPFGWFDAPQPAGSAAQRVSGSPGGAAPVVTLPREIVREVERDLREVPRLAPLKREAEVVAVRAAPVAVEVAVELWTEGEAGGVLLVTQGRPDGRCVALANAMLLAAGVKETAVAWVGYSGKPEATMLIAAMRGQAPKQVLVLGQAPLGVLLGRNLGVEGWHAATNKEIAGWDSAPVGVTYPLELLLKQSLFKRLAWQHLLAWGEDTVTTRQDNSLVSNTSEQGE